MLPGVSVFLDVDDLEEIGDLEGYIERTSIILVYCSKGYFTSKNCMRELVSSTIQQKPIIALIDTDASRGGLSLAEVHDQLEEAEGSYAKWGFDAETTPSYPTIPDTLTTDATSQNETYILEKALAFQRAQLSQLHRAVQPDSEAHARVGVGR